jgi:YYY domain-containing protein
MFSFLLWFLLSTLLGWLTFPLAYYLFPTLKDRGYTLARALSLLVWGYIFWMLASLGIAQNDIGGLLLGMVVLAALSAWAIASLQSPIANSPILAFLRTNRRLILTVEILFFLSFAFMALIRSANPEILGTEKPMELMMIHGVMNSPTFPPRDLWLSGYSISYYHFGYVMTAMLATFTGTPATAAFNLMIALIFALSAVGAYGILFNLLANYQLPITDNKEKASSLQSPFPPLLAPLFLLLVSNVEGFLEVLHRRGVLWTSGNNFWTWLGIPELRDAPAEPLAWVPERFWWWWRASRVIIDSDLQNNPTGDVISEFPAFSFILGDLHPHVLAMPFVLLAAAVALNIFLGGFKGTVDLRFARLRISKTGFFLVALLIGGLAFLNTWDILIAGALILFSYVLARVRESGWGWERLEDLFLLGIPMLIVAYVMYLPFFIGFDSQAGGILPSFMYPTRGAQLWVMWGTLFIPLFAFLVYRRANGTANWRVGLRVSFGIVLVLFLAMFTVGWVALVARPDLIDPLVVSQAGGTSGFIAASMSRRLSYIGSLITLLTLMIPTLSYLLANDHKEYTGEVAPVEANQPSHTFALLLIFLGLLLILGPEFVYLRDNFGYRINTIFKFYFQAWMMLSLAAAYGVAVLLKNLRGWANAAFSAVLALVLIVGLTYPALGFANRTNNFQPPFFGFTLDDFDRVEVENPDEAAAIRWLQSAPDGVVAEAVGGAYSAYARISIYTGLPTVLGWGNHEGQWRDQALQGTRAQDIELLYSTPDWFTAQEIITRYDIRYVYVGNLERSTYAVNEEKFFLFLKVAFQQGNVTVYEAP